MADPLPSCVIEEIEDVPMEPPAGCIKVTADGGVLKHVVTEGSGATPVLHAKCLGARSSYCDKPHGVT